jgi:hypothetical protein
MRVMSENYAHPYIHSHHSPTLNMLTILANKSPHHANELCMYLYWDTYKT